MSSTNCVECRLSLRAVTTLLLLGWFSYGNSAEIFFWDDSYEETGTIDSGPDGNYGSGSLMIVGAIEPGDYDKMISVITAYVQLPNRVNISSLGGDVPTAFAIGRFFRASLVTVSVSPSDECVSACFLILVGSPMRAVSAPIGIHRAYFDPQYFATLSPVEAEEQFRELDTYVRSYLSEMDVPEKVIGRMMATKSTDATYLQPEEFYEQIGRISPAYEEWRIAKCGELSEADSNHAGVIFALRYYEAIVREVKDGGKLTDEDREWIEENKSVVQLAMDFGEKHRDDVMDRVNKVSRCTNDAVVARHQEVYEQLIDRE